MVGDTAFVAGIGFAALNFIAETGRTDEFEQFLSDKTARPKASPGAFREAMGCARLLCLSMAHGRSEP